MSTLHVTDRFDPNINVKVLVYEISRGRDPRPRLVQQRLSHNVMTNTGRNWLVRRLGASSYAQAAPTAHTSAAIKYMGLGCGGALQTAANFAATQVELASVLALENPVAVSGLPGALRTYLKAVNAQEDNSLYFPGIGRTVFVCTFLDSEVSFAGSTTALGNVVNTEVPVSEFGLYLSTAWPTYDSVLPATVDTADPTAPNQLVAYNCVDPIGVTPNTLIRCEWELRV